MKRLPLQLSHFALLLWTLLYPLSAFGKPACLRLQQPVTSLSDNQLVMEKEGILESRREIKMFTAIGDEIQLKPPCSVHWQRKKEAYKKYKEAESKLNFPQIVNKHLVPKYRNQLNAISAEAEAHDKAYRRCFTNQLTRFPEVYNHDLEPARTIDEFEATLKKINKRFTECEYAHRLAQTNMELKRRGLK